MKLKKKTYFNWSSGKDASLAFYILMKTHDVNLLLTSVNTHYNRVSMHGLHRELLKQQAESIGIPLKTIELPENPTMEEYNYQMKQTVTELVKQGYSDCGFGDIYLEDLKCYRETQLKPYGISCHFPLWKKDTKEIINDFVKYGFKAIVICVNATLLDKSFVGREFNDSFINDLPPNIDPCGENGEFHTFCYAGPIFKKQLMFDIGEKIYKTYKNPKKGEKNFIGFWFCNLIPHL